MSGQYIDDGRVQLLDHIGSGGWGVVYLAKDMTHKHAEIVAVKVVCRPKMNSRQFTLLTRELTFHRLMSDHTNVVSMRRVFVDHSFAYIVLDYCPGGDMWGAILNDSIFARNDKLVKRVFIQLIDALQACHDKGIYHRDLKPNNILMNEDYSKVFLADFGLATDQKWCEATHAGTLWYKSPECCNHEGQYLRYSAERNDIWALGVILVNMLSGTFAWQEASSSQSAYKAFRTDPNFLRMVLPISEEASFILRKIFSEREEDTITLEHLRFLVKRAKTFWMSDEEVLERGSKMTWIRRCYLHRDARPKVVDKREEARREKLRNALALDHSHKVHASKISGRQAEKQMPEPRSYHANPRVSAVSQPTSLLRPSAITSSVNTCSPSTIDTPISTSSLRQQSSMMEGNIKVPRLRDTIKRLFAAQHLSVNI